MTSKISIDNRKLLQKISTGEAAAGIDFGNAIVRELAAFRLAVMDSEPVAYTDEEELNFVNDMACMWTKGMGINEVPLYRHAQPAPVVPNGLRLALSNAGIAAPESDEMLAATCEKHIQALVTWVKDRKPFQSAPVVPSFEEWLSAANRKPLGWVKDAMREAYDACRAAMLQAGNSPVIPDGWTGNDKANAALIMLDRIETVDPVDDDRIEGIKRIVRELVAAPTGIPVIPDGYVMVPIEPNGDMLAAAQDAYGETDGDIASTLRAAMLAASPQEVKGES